MPFPEKYLDLFDKNKKVFLYLATVNAKGMPQVTPVWFDTEGDYILINTKVGRLKDRNMKERPEQISIAIPDPIDPDRYLGIRGKVVSFTTDGAEEHINKLSLRYYGKPWTYREGEQRIIFKIEPTRFDEH
ncbi:MAG TPA: PPOX class F420-dependent oxidoreductase [Anaerolineae bacterium]|nr:PPOX class F420-dependent oxidoreductase [Anaerolineae bacterium]HCK66514.1 PPOX class F420-dependent oxidoreductase [Anaerolineae bacterium]